MPRKGRCCIRGGVGAEGARGEDIKAGGPDRHQVRDRQCSQGDSLWGPPHTWGLAGEPQVYKGLRVLFSGFETGGLRSVYLHHQGSRARLLHQ